MKEASGGKMTIAVAGCVAQAEGAEIMRRQPAVDLVLGPQAYHKLPEMVARASRAAGERLETEFETLEKFDALPKTREADGPAAFLSIQEGCDKFCTFCVVPYTRGAELSRPVDDITFEARNLAAQGVRDISLLGQNVNAWHGESPDGSEWGLGRLLRELAEIDGLDRLRYTTSHPRDMDEDLIAAHRDLGALMPYLHLPVQAGSDRILKAMNRKHTGDEYRRLVDRIRAARPDIALSGDFIVGFPGETDVDFEDTMRLIADIGYAQAFSFKYSPRPGTPGADLKDQVPEQVKNERLYRLQSLLGKQQADFMNGLIGKTISVLLEKPGREPGQIVGRSPWLQPAVCDENVGKIGDIVSVRITRTSANSLIADNRKVDTEA